MTIAPRIPNPRSLAITYDPISFSMRRVRATEVPCAVPSVADPRRPGVVGASTPASLPRRRNADTMVPSWT